MGSSPNGHKESDTTERLTHTLVNQRFSAAALVTSRLSNRCRGAVLRTAGY